MANAGLKSGDIILSFDVIVVDDNKKLLNLMENPSSSPLKIALLREGKEISVNVFLKQ